MVDQHQFGIVYQLGEIQKVITQSGLQFKLPSPFQNVRYIDKSLLTLPSSASEPERQRVVIDWYVRWRISDPLAYIRNVGIDERAGVAQLNRVVRNSFQEEVNKRTVKQLLGSEREALINAVKQQVVGAVQGSQKPWVLEVVDVRITPSVYARMEAERKRVANELRSGRRWSAK